MLDPNDADLQDQLRRYGAALDALADQAPLDAMARLRHVGRRGRFALAGAVAASLVAGVLVVMSRDTSDDDRVTTAEEGAPTAGQLTADDLAGRTSSCSRSRSTASTSRSRLLTRP